MEIIWLLNYADSDCGLQSNWNSMVQQALLPSSSYSDPYDTHTLRAVHRRRDIQKAFLALPQLQQNALFLSFGPTILPTYTEKIFQELAGAVLAINPKFNLIASRYLLGTGTTEDKIVISEIRTEAMKLKLLSLHNYHKARQ